MLSVSSPQQNSMQALNDSTGNKKVKRFTLKLINTSAQNSLIPPKIGVTTLSGQLKRKKKKKKKVKLKLNASLPIKSTQ